MTRDAHDAERAEMRRLGMTQSDIDALSAPKVGESADAAEVKRKCPDPKAFPGRVGNNHVR